MERRNTIQKNLVLNAVLELHQHASADQVYELIKKEHPSIGKGTVYRNLNILAEEGKIRKVEIPNGADRFDFTLEDHHHVICIKCGEVFDVKMDEQLDVEDHIKSRHGIKLLNYEILFRGICPKCQKKEEKNERQSNV